MNLPVIQSAPLASDDGSLFRQFERAARHFAEQIAEATELDFGVAMANPAFPLVHDANHIRQVRLPDGMKPAEAMRIVDEHFAQVGTRCRRWEFSLSAELEAARQMAAELESRGWHRETADVMLLRESHAAPEPALTQLSIIPGRAGYLRYEEISRQSAARWPDAAAQLLQASMQRLDDPHWDCWLALSAGKAVGRAGVLSAGDTGLIESLFVAGESRRKGVATALVNRLIDICARSQFRHVFLEVAGENSEGRNLYHKLGFEQIGQITQFVAGPA
jgi:ribosomal protein S18 acetylase RimI-like enzyme